MVMTSKKPTLLWYCCIYNRLYYTYRLYSIVDTDCNEWGVWSKCSKTCGNGVLTRYRLCPSKRADDDLYFPRNDKQAMSCSITTCPGIYYNIVFSFFLLFLFLKVLVCFVLWEYYRNSTIRLYNNANYPWLDKMSTVDSRVQNTSIRLVAM